MQKSYTAGGFFYLKTPRLFLCQNGGETTMTNEKLNTALYEKMFAEQETYRAWLLSQPPEEILNHIYEYTCREDILRTAIHSRRAVHYGRKVRSLKAPQCGIYHRRERRQYECLITGSCRIWKTLG